jgi:dolichol-phosphate mannosyltransferase
MKTIIAIPTYNEFGNINNLIESIASETADLDILFIDDNSSDGTLELIKKHIMVNNKIKLILNMKKMGVGSAHLDAINYAYTNNYEILITMDADFTHHPSYINSMIGAMGDNHIVIGSRHEKKDSIASWPLFRKLLTLAAYFFTKYLLKINFDATSGFRLYNLNQINSNLFNNIKSKGYSFFIETSFIFNETLTVKTLPIDMPIRFAEKSKMKINDMIATVLLMLKLFFKKFN